MLHAIRLSLSDLASSNNQEDGEDEDQDKDDTKLGNMSKGDKPCWVIDSICKMVQYRKESFEQTGMSLDHLTQLEWRDSANYFCQRDTKYRMTELKVSTVVKLQTDTAAATPPPK
jgi:hypothetical protein